jgi:hypothetical protein
MGLFVRDDGPDDLTRKIMKLKAFGYALRSEIYIRK